jgi:hypothetical protein
VLQGLVSNLTKVSQCCHEDVGLVLLFLYIVVLKL